MLGETRFFTRLCLALAALVLLITSSAVLLARVVPTQGVIAFQGYRNEGSGIYLLDLRTRLTHPLAHEAGTYRHVAWSPDGTRMAFSFFREGNLDIYIINADGSDLQRISDDTGDEAYPVWSPDGRAMLYSVQEETVGMMIDYLDGRQQPVELRTPFYGYPQWVDEGRAVLFAGSVNNHYDLYLLTVADNSVKNLTQTPELYEESPVMSPDKRWIAFTTDGDVYGLDLQRELLYRLTYHLSWDGRPAWSPDGRWLAYLSERNVTSQIYVMAADCLQQAELCENSTYRVSDTRALSSSPMSWSPDSRWLAFTGDSSVVNGSAEIFIVDITCVELPGGCTAEHTRQLTDHPLSDSAPVWQP